METSEKKDMDLIEHMANDCLGRLDSVKEDIKAGKHGTARNDLRTVITLLETIQTIKKGAKWANDD